MKHMEIFEQAMCCPTGLCGPSIDPELLRVSTVLDTLKQHGIDVAAEGKAIAKVDNLVIFVPLHAAEMSIPNKDSTNWLKQTIERS